MKRESGILCRQLSLSMIFCLLGLFQLLKKQMIVYKGMTGCHKENILICSSSHFFLITPLLKGSLNVQSIQVLVNSMWVKYLQVCLTIHEWINAIFSYTMDISKDFIIFFTLLCIMLLLCPLERSKYSQYSK